MRVLAIETATAEVGLAIADEAGIVAELRLRAGRRHAEVLNLGVTDLLDLSATLLGDIAALAVDIGPGLFTGIRVGVAAAKGFAMGLDKPIVALTSLQIIASACATFGQQDALGVVDLRRGEVAWQIPGSAPSHGPPEALIESLANLETGGHRLFLAGDGALRYATQLRNALGKRVAIGGSDLAAPPVASLAVRAITEVAAGRAVDAAEVLPEYLRDADVRINWSTRHDSPRQADR